MFVEYPHLPEREVKLFLVDPSVKNIKLNNSVKAYKHNNLLNGIDTHPDMTFCPLKNGECVVEKNSFNYYNNLLSPYGIKVMAGENDVSKDYPYDIAYNCVILDGKLFHNIKYTDKVILKYCEDNNINPVNVKQGYTKCSTLIVDEKSVITCDEKLNEIYLKNGIDSLCVDNKTIFLKGFDHGFIGGCGGKISQNKIAFFGNIESHPDFVKIKNFLNTKGISYINLWRGNLTDFGTLIPLIYYIS